jgi:hypothetical protein
MRSDGCGIRRQSTESLGFPIDLLFEFPQRLLCKLLDQHFLEIEG